MIPARLLVHECALMKRTGVDRARNPTYAEAVALKRVRIGATLQTAQGATGEVKADALTLFIDAENTRWETADGAEAERILPEALDAVVWNGKTYTVRSVTPCYAQGAGPHHWEVALE